MSDATRLHISGLTPSISAQDIASKLSSFGKVQTVDGFGARDGNGDPRKFAYVTLEAQPAQVSKCVSALSGTTWKGARLRLAPAKPDFTARWAQEHDTADAEPPKKRRKRMRGTHGVEARDMAPVTLENYERHRGWYKTPLDHLVRPIRMRPAHPLPPILAKEVKAIKDKQKTKKDKKKIKPPPSRARRRLLDPARWGVTHLSGPLLENAVVSGPQAAAHASEDVKQNDGDESDEASSDADESDEASSDTEPEAPVPVKSTKVVDAITSTLRKEASHSRKLLDNLFGADEDEWMAPDALDSDLEELIQQHVPTSGVVDDESIEDDNAIEDQGNDPMDEDRVERDDSTAPTFVPVTVQARSLKDMFAPREEEAGFSLMANLDFDLELDDELSLLAPAPVPPPVSAAPQSMPSAPVIITVPPSSTADEWRIAADAPGVRPLFFPTAVNISITARFCRTETEEQIRSRWEERKGLLTAEWKKRSREAKKRGRRGGVGASVEE